MKIIFLSQTKWMVVWLAGFLAFAAATSAGENATFEAARGKALELHRSLIGFASPQVRAKIAASAQASKNFLAKCGQNCDLHKFYSKDLAMRFGRLSDKEHQLLETLVFAETVGDLNQFDKLDMPDKLQKQSQVFQAISGILKNQHDTLKAIIQNLR